MKQIVVRGAALKCLCIGFTLIAAGRFAAAQSTSGDLVGTVRDPSGAVVNAAKVDVVNEGTGVRTSATTTSNGGYHFNNLLIGRYDLMVAAPGFSSSQVKGIGVELNKTATQNVELSLQATATTVDVTEAAAAIDTTTAQIQSNFNSKLTADLPVASGNNAGVLNLSLLGAGVANAGGVGIGTGPSVGGQRPSSNNFTVEGIDNNLKATTGALNFVPNDAVSEFTLIQNQYNAEFGHSAGGQFNTSIKSGTNEFHGALYDYLQNRNLNALDQTQANSGILTQPRFDSNRLGASVGGPIKRNKLFFYSLFEYNPTGQASTPNSAILAPTTAGFSQLAAMPGINPTALKTLQTYVPGVTSATTSVPVGPPGAPTTQIPVGVFSVAAPNFQNAYYGVASVDYNLSDKDQLRGRYIYNRVDSIDTAGTLPQFFATQPTRSYLATLTEYHNFAPTVQNEFRLGYTRLNQNYPVPNVTYPGLDQFPNLVFNDLSLPIGPDSVAPQFTVSNSYEIVDNLTWTKGAHTFKFGFDGRKYISPQSFTQRSRGDYEYSTVSSYLYDQLPDQVAQRSLGTPVYYGDQIATYLYAQDQWKVNQHLTLDLGLRWEFTSVPYSERSQSLNAISNVPGLITFSTPQPQYKNFAPRIGVAYSPGDSGKTAIRAGFGINYDVIFDNIGILDLPPQTSTTVDLLTLSTAQKAQYQNNFLANGGIRPSFTGGPLSQADARASTAAYIPNQRLPYSINWNFGIQHEFANNYTLDVRYLGTRGVHLDVQNRINYLSPVNADNSLPTFFTTPSAAQLSGLTRTVSSFPSDPQIPAYANAGFQSSIVENSPIGNSIYNGLAIQLNRRFSNGLQFVGAYTWSHNIDNSTADFFTTNLTPRRPQDFQNIANDRSSSALDRRHRFTMTVVYDVPFYKTGNRNWFLKNLVGNWQIAPIYTYESPEYATVQSAVDSNLNGDNAPDRSIINPNGVGNTGSDVHGVNNLGQTVTDPTAIVAYVANNPNAKYVVAGAGAFPSAGRNTLPLRPTDNIDVSLVKRFNLTERTHLELAGYLLNALNHPQFTGGYLSRVDGGNTNLVGIASSVGVRNLLTPGNAAFDRPDLAFSSNPRIITVSAKITF